MKLLTRYNRVTLITTVVVMLITGLVYYDAIRLILISDVDKDLAVEENEVFEYVKQNHQLPQVYESNDQQITFSEASPGSVKRQFIDAEYKKSDNPKRHRRHRGQEYEEGRGLVTSVIAGDKYYRVLIVKSTVETEDLVKIIFGITIAVIMLLLLTLFIANRLLLTRLWKPFHLQLQELRQFNLSDNKNIPRIESNVDEFKELNQVVVEMSSKVKNDYKDLKTFTENASHELLTPIAVINSKLDTLLQTDNFSQQQSKLLNDLYSAVSRLTRLNQSLLLLVKIENRLVENLRLINLRTSVDDIVVQFEEIFNDKNLKVTCELEDKEIYASPYLVDILLNNLVSNAIRHNHDGGEIRIKLNDGRLSIENTGENTELDVDKIFARFQKSSNSEGAGLGLTISKQICENLRFNLQYTYKAPYHKFAIVF